jgi:hypothetical protein
MVMVTSKLRAARVVSAGIAVAISVWTAGVDLSQGVERS